MTPPKFILSTLATALVFNLNAQILFEESSLSAGLDFEYKEALKMGGGAASFDYDNDGDEDIYIVGGQNPDGLFENDGSGGFTNVSSSTHISTLTDSLTTTSVVTGDIDNDGYREVFIGTMGTIGTAIENIQRNILLRYDPQTGKFENIIEESMILDQSFCMGGHFFDSNLDGYLDLYVINYVAEPGFIQEGSDIIGFDHECYENKLYINNGNGSFSDLTVYYGLDQEACSLAATSSDLDWDGDPDIIVANDFGKWLERNQLFKNEGEENTYTDISQSSNTNAQMYGMGISIGDYDEDLDMDFYVTNIGSNFFFENLGDMTFTDIADNKGLQNSTSEDGFNTTGWGAIFDDFNNDTYLDLFVANGYVYSVVDVDDISQNDELYLGSDDHTFDNVSIQSGISFYGPSRGALTGDWNQDGSLDIITITNENLTSGFQNSLNLYSNLQTDKNWIGFDLVGTTSNADAYGSKVILYADGRALMREIAGGDSHASQSSSKVHFGLGEIDQVDSILIHWPSGLIEKKEGISTRFYHQMVEGLNTIISDNYQILSDIKINPNPTRSFLNIEVKEIDDKPVRMRLFDLKGSLILTKEITTRSNRIDIRDLASGLYKIVIYSNSKMISETISIIKP